MCAIAAAGSVVRREGGLDGAFCATIGGKLKVFCSRKTYK